MSGVVARKAILGGWLIALLAVAPGCSAQPIEVNPALAIARLDEVPPGGALYSVAHDLYLTDAGDAGLIAISRRDPFRGCTVQYLDEEETIEGWRLEPDARFVDPCHGGQYDIAGYFITGPGDADLTRFAIEVIGGVVYLDATPNK